MPMVCTADGKSDGSGPCPDQMSRTVAGLGVLARAAQRTRWRNGDAPAERTTTVTVQDAASSSLPGPRRFGAVSPELVVTLGDCLQDRCPPRRTRTGNLRVPKAES